MPPKSQKTGGGAAAAASAPPFNEKDLKFIKSIMDNMPGKPNCDWGNVATSAGVKDAKQATEKFRVMSIKYGWQGKAPPASPAVPSAADARFIKAVFDSMQGRPDTNWEQVAVDYGSKDKKQAMEKYRVMAIKMNWPRGAIPSPAKAAASAAAAVAPKAGGGKSKAAAKVGKGKKRTLDDTDADDASSEREDVVTPPGKVAARPASTANGKTRAAKKTVNYADDGSDGADDEFALRPDRLGPKARAVAQKRAKIHDDAAELAQRNDLAQLHGPLFPNLAKKEGSARSIAALAGDSEGGDADDEQGTDPENIIPSIEDEENEQAEEDYGVV